MCTSLPRLSFLVIFGILVIRSTFAAPQIIARPTPIVPRPIVPITPIIPRPIAPIVPRPIVPIVPRVYSDEIPTPYEYEYKVENPPTNTYYGKNEIGDGAGRVTGSYYVYLPDGRLMTVDYTADQDTGFVPRVSFGSQTAYPGVAVAHVA